MCWEGGSVKPPDAATWFHFNRSIFVSPPTSFWTLPYKSRDRQTHRQKSVIYQTTNKSTIRVIHTSREISPYCKYRSGCFKGLCIPDLGHWRKLATKGAGSVVSGMVKRGFRVLRLRGCGMAMIAPPEAVGAVCCHCPCTIFWTAYGGDSVPNEAGSNVAHEGSAGAVDEALRGWLVATAKARRHRAAHDEPAAATPRCVLGHITMVQ